MAIRFELSDGLRRKVEFGPDAVVWRGHAYRYADMSVLPHLVRMRNSWSGYGIEFTQRGGKRRRGAVLSAARQKAELAEEAVRYAVERGRVPPVLQAGVEYTQGGVATAQKAKTPPKPRKPLCERVNVEGLIALLLGIAAWLGVALVVGVGFGLGMPYGLFIATVLAIPFLFPGLGTALFFLDLFDCAGKRGRRRR